MHENNELLHVVSEVVVEIGPELIHAIQHVIAVNREIEARLGSMEGKLDALTVREIQSAFKIISGLTTIDSRSMQARHLDSAEAMFLSHIGLDSDSNILGKTSAYWVARSYFGLSCVALLRGESTDAARFLLRAFIADPRSGRNEFGGEFFKRAFESHCSEFYASYESEMTKLPGYNRERGEIEKSLFWKKGRRALEVTGKVALVAGAAYVAMHNKKPIHRPKNFNATSSSVDSKIEALERRLRAIPTEAGIKETLESAIDQRCRQLATINLGVASKAD